MLACLSSAHSSPNQLNAILINSFSRANNCNWFRWQMHFQFHRKPLATLELGSQTVNFTLCLSLRQTRSMSARCAITISFPTLLSVFVFFILFFACDTRHTTHMFAINLLHGTCVWSVSLYVCVYLCVCVSHDLPKQNMGTETAVMQSIETTSNESNPHRWRAHKKPNVFFHFFMVCRAIWNRKRKSNIEQRWIQLIFYRFNAHATINYRWAANRAHCIGALGAHRRKYRFH